MAEPGSIKKELRASLVGRFTCHRGFVLFTAPVGMCPVLCPVQRPSMGLRPPLLVVGSHQEVRHPELLIIGSTHGTHWSVSRSSWRSVSGSFPPGIQTSLWPLVDPWLQSPCRFRCPVYSVDLEVHARPEAQASLLGRSTRHHGFFLATALIGMGQVLHRVQRLLRGSDRHWGLLGLITNSSSSGTVDCWVSPRLPLGRVQFFLGVDFPEPPSGNQEVTVAVC